MNDQSHPELPVTVRLQFQYKHSSWDRPEDCAQDEPLDGPGIPIPNVGDSVSLRWNDERQAHKVLTRHFSYFELDSGILCTVNVVVTDMDGEEYRARLKE